MTGEDPEYLWDGGFPAWSLPLDRTGAEFARAIVRTVFTELGLTPALTYDAMVIVSELATNALVHALPVGETHPVASGPEIWAYVSRKEYPEVVLKVFDPLPWQGPLLPPPAHAPSDATGGRGLEVVDTLTAEYGGRWGVHPTRSRLGSAPLSGKAVFFTAPLPADRRTAFTRVGPRPGRRSAERIHALLVRRGLRPRLSTGHRNAVVEVGAGLHIWVREESLSYRLPGHGVIWHPPFDEVEVVEQVIRHCEELAGTASRAS